MRVLATFVTWRDSVYRIIGGSLSMGKHDTLFISTARSFRPMTRELLAEVHEMRLRLIGAQPAETLVELAARAGSDWTGLQLVVLNGMQPSHRFEGGELVKITKFEAYVPQGAEGGGGP